MKKIMQTVLFYRQSKQRLKGMNKKEIRLTERMSNVIIKSGGRRIKLCILHKQGGKF